MIVTWYKLVTIIATLFWLAAPILALLHRRRAAHIANVATACVVFAWQVVPLAYFVPTTFIGVNAWNVIVILIVPTLSLVGSALALRWQSKLGIVAWVGSGLSVAELLLWAWMWFHENFGWIELNICGRLDWYLC